MVSRADCIVLLRSDQTLPSERLHSMHARVLVQMSSRQTSRTLCLIPVFEMSLPPGEVVDANPGTQRTLWAVYHI